jgi:hypothetical protein
MVTVSIPTLFQQVNHITMFTYDVKVLMIAYEILGFDRNLRHKLRFFEEIE